jgi:hypothetical protein
MHPQMIGRRSRVALLERLVQYMKRKRWGVVREPRNRLRFM